MRFLLDENLPERTGDLLADADHEVLHVRRLGLASADDETVLALADRDEAVLISAARPGHRDRREVKYPRSQ